MLRGLSSLRSHGLNFLKLNDILAAEMVRKVTHQKEMFGAGDHSQLPAISGSRGYPSKVVVGRGRVRGQVLTSRHHMMTSHGKHWTSRHQTAKKRHLTGEWKHVLILVF